MQVGSAALDLLLKTATVPQKNELTGRVENVPAFLHTHAFNRTGKHKTRYGVVEWHPELRKQMQDGETAVQGMLHPRYMPMLVKPRPWRRFNDGGYLTLSSMVMRGVYSRQGPSAQQLDELKKWESGLFVAGDGMKRLYEALNILGAQGWKINASVLHTMNTLWEQGGGIAGLPSRTPLTAPEPPVRLMSLVSCLDCSLGTRLCELSSSHRSVGVWRGWRVRSNRSFTRITTAARWWWGPRCRRWRCGTTGER